MDTINDDVLKQAGQEFVSFVFGLEVEGMDVSQFQEAKPAAHSGAAAPFAKPGGGTSSPPPQRM